MTNDLNDTRDIPDQPAYWSGLTARVAMRATADRRTRIAVIALSRWSLPAAGAAFVAAATIALIVFGGSGNARTPALAWPAAFASNDALARSVIASPEPPQIPLLMVRAPASVVTGRAQ